MDTTRYSRSSKTCQGQSPVVGIHTKAGIVDAAAGDRYYLAFQDAYPGGRVPVLAPIEWGSDGFPVFQSTDNSWNVSYPYLNVPQPPYTVKVPTGIDTFRGRSLSPEWEWNHNPDNTKWSVDNGLCLQKATVTMDLYAARMRSLIES